MKLTPNSREASTPRPRRLLRHLPNLVLAGIAAAMLLSGCGAMLAQNPSSTLKPVNAVSAEPEQRLMLKGADVVAYFTQGRYGLPLCQRRAQGAVRPEPAQVPAAVRRLLRQRHRLRHPVGR
jgi:hypothetical protein